MPLDPNAAELLKQLQESGVPPLDSGTVDEARQNALALALAAGEPEPVATVEDDRIPGPGGKIAIRKYAPAQPGPLPAFVFFHGGGWVICNLDTHDGLCRALANAVPAVVVSVDYRLAPEHKFPAAADDAYAATRWVAEHARELGADPSRLIVGGDSAGGNLAAAVSLMARDRRAPGLDYQLLVYPVIDARMDTPSYSENSDGYLLTRSAMAWYWNHYLRDERDGRHSYASPILAEKLDGLPPATIITAEFDPLRDEAEAYAERLRAAGVAVRKRRYDGMIHAFFSMGSVFPQAKTALLKAASDIRNAFGGP